MSRDLRPIVEGMERALIDLQGPLDALGLLADTLPPEQAAPMAWLVETASSTARLREDWEKLHAVTAESRAKDWAAGEDDGPALRP